MWRSPIAGTFLLDVSLSFGPLPVSRTIYYPFSCVHPAYTPDLQIFIFLLKASMLGFYFLLFLSPLAIWYAAFYIFFTFYRLCFPLVYLLLVILFLKIIIYSFCI